MSELVSYTVGTGLARAYRATPIPDYDVAATCVGGAVKLKVKVVNNHDEDVDINVITSVAARFINKALIVGC